MELKPPFEFEVSKAGRQYVLVCAPNEVAAGSFKPHLVIRLAETWKVVTFMNISGPPLLDVSEAAGIAYQAGEDWLQCRAAENDTHSAPTATVDLRPRLLPLL